MAGGKGPGLVLISARLPGSGVARLPQWCNLPLLLHACCRGVL